LRLHWQDLHILENIPTRVCGSQSTHNSNYPLLNSKNLKAIRRVAPENKYPSKDIIKTMSLFILRLPKGFQSNCLFEACTAFFESL
jgi:hypothetical protein